MIPYVSVAPCDLIRITKYKCNVNNFLLNYFYTKKAGSNELALRFNVCLISLFGLFILYELCSISLCFVEYILFIFCVVWFIFSCLCFVELNSFVLLIYTFVNFYYLVLFILLENIFVFRM